VNAYIKEISGKDFSAKDFRTWHGSLCAVLALKDLGNQDTQHSMKQNIIMALDLVSKQLGNSRNVCRKYYVHPVIISLYESKRLNKYLSLKGRETVLNGLDVHEKLLLRIFEKETIKSNK
ncbi:MAG: DNA topoisomerase IB, partial [Bacteroidia bacterium]|nr:DNA topoisomerase IB [Bacteroidia bacterium]